MKNRPRRGGFSDVLVVDLERGIFHRVFVLVGEHIIYRGSRKYVLLVLVCIGFFLIHESMAYLITERLICTKSSLLGKNLP